MNQNRDYIQSPVLTTVIAGFTGFAADLIHSPVVISALLGFFSSVVVEFFKAYRDKRDALNQMRALETERQRLQNRVNELEGQLSQFERRGVPRRKVSGRLSE